MTGLTRLVRRLRFGQPVIIVSGLPRSGTSMMMQMLAAGGVDLVSDAVRGADDSNPEGYLELEAVKRLEQDPAPAWLAGARGRAVKVLSPLLAALPETYNYQVILMQRDLAEVIASQNAMLKRRGEATDRLSDEDLRRTYEVHARKVARLLDERRCFEWLTVAHRAVLADPRAEALRVSRFLGRPLDVDRMAAAVDARLYRNREM